MGLRAGLGFRVAVGNARDRDLVQVPPQDQHAGRCNSESGRRLPASSFLVLSQARAACPDGEPFATGHGPTPALHLVVPDIQRPMHLRPETPRERGTLRLAFYSREMEVRQDQSCFKKCNLPELPSAFLQDLAQNSDKLTRGQGSRLTASTSVACSLALLRNCMDS